MKNIGHNRRVANPNRLSQGPSVNYVRKMALFSGDVCVWTSSYFRLGRDLEVPGLANPRWLLMFESFLTDQVMSCSAKPANPLGLNPIA